jgi:AcrR family transcriptional regulator
VTRTADPSKRQALLDQIVDYLVDKPLSALTFRSLAETLGVSTFTLVYHFGTRADLVREIIATIARRERGLESVLDPDAPTLTGYFDGLRDSFELTLQPRNRALQRLEFEAQMVEALEPETSVTRNVHGELQERGRETLVALGLTDADAMIESRYLIDTFYGIQVGLIVHGDDQRATLAFDRAMDQHRTRIEQLTA